MRCRKFKNKKNKTNHLMRKNRILNDLIQSVIISLITQTLIILNFKTRTSMEKFVLKILARFIIWGKRLDQDDMAL
jgi:hypothetical protein